MFEFLNSFFDATLGYLLGLPNPYGLMIVSFILTFLMTLAYKFFTNQEVMKTLKEELKEMQTGLKDTTQTVEKKMHLQKNMMAKNMEYMKHSLKPMLITFLPIIIIFGWLRGYYTSLDNPKIFFGLTWLWSYMVFSIIFSITLRKIMKVN
ncbi:MAG: EMC3/TMCO1 family protein [archaeon]